MDLLILGCGYTGQRIAKRFLARGARVIATTRDPQRLAHLGTNIEAIDIRNVPAHIRAGCLVVHSIPPERWPAEPDGFLNLLGTAPKRVVYLSSTGVYGSAEFVNATTPVECDTERARARLAVERTVAVGPWSSLILRPAAIYGPGRGVHESIQQGVYRLGENFVSRIHVEDLAAHVEAALLSTLSGAYPVADEKPCTSREITEFCAGLLNLPNRPHHPLNVETETESATRPISNRRVDGSAIRRALGITLTFPSYRVGIPAALGM